MGIPESIAVRRRILVVEDEPLNLRIAVAMLQKLGNEVITATTGREAVAVFETAKPDLVLLDLGLPDMRGHRVARQLRKLGHTIPIHALTAEDEDDAALADAGFDGYVGKPLREADLARLFAESAVVEAAPAATPVLDLAGLRERVCGDEGLVRELLVDFVSITDGLLHDVDEALVSECRTAVKAMTHRLKGAMLAIGATKASASARLLEDSALTAEFAALRAMLETVTDDVAEATVAAKNA